PGLSGGVERCRRQDAVRRRAIAGHAVLVGGVGGRQVFGHRQRRPEHGRRGGRQEQRLGDEATEQVEHRRLVAGQGLAARQLGEEWWSKLRHFCSLRSWPVGGGRSYSVRLSLPLPSSFAACRLLGLPCDDFLCLTGGRNPLTKSSRPEREGPNNER